MKKTFLLTIVFLLGITALHAQDKIYLRAKKGFINAKITELGLEEVKYKEADNLEGPQFTLEKDDIEKIVYANGRLETFERSMAAKVSIKEMHKNNLKFAFLAPLTDHLHFTYERAVKQGQAWEAHASFVGLGMHHQQSLYAGNGTYTMVSPKRAGVMLGAGYKFIFIPDYIQRGVRTRHILQGSYVRPSIYAGSFSKNNYSYSTGYLTTIKKTVTTAALMVEFGKEWIFNNRISLDIDFGLGYGAENVKRSATDNINIDDFVSFYFTHARLSGNTTSDSYFGISSGIKMGYLFHGKKERILSLEKENIK